MDSAGQRTSQRPSDEILALPVIEGESEDAHARIHGVVGTHQVEPVGDPAAHDVGYQAGRHAALKGGRLAFSSRLEGRQLRGGVLGVQCRRIRSAGRPRAVLDDRW